MKKGRSAFIVAVRASTRRNWRLFICRVPDGELDATVNTVRRGMGIFSDYKFIAMAYA